MLDSSPRQNDISRILDPSYSPQSSSINNSQMAYVDTHGLLHDPDYRDFPTLIPHTAKRSHTHSSRVAATPCHSLSAAAYHASRAPWDRSEYLDDTLSDRDDAHADSDDEDDDDCCRSCDSRSCCSRSRRSSVHSPRHNLHHLFHQYHPRDLRLNYTPTYVHSSPEPSPPTSLDTDFSDDWDHDDHDDREKLRKSSRPKWSPKSEKSPRSLLFATETLPEADESPVDDVETRSCHPEWTPTCSEAMRRQWQAVSLRLRFSLFRATRKMRRRLHGG